MFPHTSDNGAQAHRRACAMLGFWQFLCLATGFVAASEWNQLGLALPSAEKWDRVRAKSDADVIIKKAFSTSTVYERLAYLTDTFGPRLSGSTALESALDWTKAQIEKDGIKVYEEPVKIPSWVRGREYATLLSPRTKDIRIAGLGGSISTPDGKPLVAKAFVVTSFDDLDKNSHQAKGRIVVFNVEFEGYGTTVDYRENAAGRAEKHGAVAVLVRSIAPYGLQTVHTGVMNEAGIPAAAITLEDAKRFERMQKRGQDVVIELYMEAHTLPDRLSRNLILEIPGSEKPEELVVIGGHMDSWDIADGAMDDGGGAFVSWEAIRLIHELGLKPKRTVRAVLFVNEENGSKGAIAYAKEHEHEANLTSIAIESDIGTFTPFGISVTCSKAAKAILTDLGQQLLSGIGSGNVSGTEYGEDVSYLYDQGVPAGSLQVLDFRVGNHDNNPCKGFGDGVSGGTDSSRSAYFWYHHTEADTVDKLDPEQLQHCAATMAVWTYSVANLDSLLPRD
ncbi:hypothetical protein R1sor_020296 [Riccia sorocarpa]|uniref:Carboxypeptidase Q n=1 Tax=Riccia sorocarpa TaxID=122646 RepID=A0ABD3IL85_9MARC